jgi:hypothetical protein
MTRPNTIASDQFLHRSVTWMIMPVMLGVSPKLITRPNTIVPSTFVRWDAIALVVWAVPPKLITRPNTVVSDKILH